MKTLFFIVVALLSALWLYLSFHFFKLDNANMANSIPYDNNYFEAIFFVWLFVFWFFLWKFFCGGKNVDTNNSEKNSSETNFFVDQEESEDKSEDEEKNDNLKIIEWIGPKVEQLLKLNWIETIRNLSESSYDDIKVILERAWDNFKIINPRSWPYQAELANEKQWGKLKEYQDFLVWGIDPSEFNK